MNIAFTDPDKDVLGQGDLLIRNESLRQALNQAHGYYARVDDYSHFMVLTQSCDLVRRNGKPPKSRYITLAAARPMRLVIDRFLESLTIKNDNLPIKICDKSRELLARQLIERIIHNTQEGLFFVPKEASDTIPEDLCVFLTLSVALRAEHFDACRLAKVAQMKDIFAAKVGWLTGTQYSQVATPDLEEEMPDQADAYKKELYRQFLYGPAAWLNQAQFNRLLPLVAKWKQDNPGSEVTREIIVQLVGKLPDDATLIAQQAAKVLVERGLVVAAEAEKAKNLILNNSEFKKLVRDTTLSQSVI